MVMITTCDKCDYSHPAMAPGDRCPVCGGVTRTDAVSSAGVARSTAQAFPPTLRVRSRFAGSWYEDALREARQGALGDYHARRREIVFSVSSAESYIYEWTFDLLEQTHGPSDINIQEYFPDSPVHGWNRGVSEQWKTVIKQLHQNGLLLAKPDLGGVHGNNWIKVVGYRNGLIHAQISRQEIYAPTQTVRPIVTTSDLASLERRS